MNEYEIVNVILDRLIKQTDEINYSSSKYWTQNQELEVSKKLSKDNYDAFIRERNVKESLVSEIESLINIATDNITIGKLDMLNQLKNMLGAN